MNSTKIKYYNQALKLIYIFIHTHTSIHHSLKEYIIYIFILTYISHNDYSHKVYLHHLDLGHSIKQKLLALSVGCTHTYSDIQNYYLIY